MDVTGGDATAIIIRDMDNKDKIIKKVLIDTGAEGSGSDWLRQYIKKYFDDFQFDLVIASHYHQDHIRGFHLPDITFIRYIDIGGYTINGVLMDPKNGVGNKVKGSRIFTGYVSSIQRSIQSLNAQRVDLPFIWKPFQGNANATTVQLIDNDITLTCYSANGIVADGKNAGNNIAGSQKGKKNRVFNPNDLSLAFVLEWKSENFRYFTAGDLSGDESQQRYYNVEAALVNHLNTVPMTVNVFKVSHHGSERSNLTSTFTRLAPETIVISCNMVKDVPHQNFLKRLNDFLGLPADDNSTVIRQTVVFSNDLYVNTKNPRYEHLVNMMPAVAASNIETKPDGSLSNIAVKSVVIRRRSGGFYDANENIADCLQRIDKNTHEIILIRRDLSEQLSAEASAAKVSTFRLPSFYNLSIDVDISEDFDDVRQSIIYGFTLQAEEMSRWLQDDEAKQVTQGRDYLKNYYPSLAKLAEDYLKQAAGADKYDVLAVNLKNEMERYLDSSYDPDDFDDLYTYDTDNDLSLDEKESLFRLLSNNTYQQIFNVTNAITNVPANILAKKDQATTWDEEYAWNDEEPYPPPDDQNNNNNATKRKYKSQPLLRRSKRVKKPTQTDPMDDK
jgi:hypothetical protein